MPYDISFNDIPAGTAINAAKSGEEVMVRAIEFVSEEDGNVLIERLEGFGGTILGKLPTISPIQPNEVKHLLAIIRRDKSATVYINELKIVGHVQVKKEFEKGDSIFLDDIADVQGLEFEGIDINCDVGIIFIFYVGWRRAIFYDLAPLHRGNKDRDYDITRTLGQFYSYLMFYRRFAISDQAWKNLFEDQWFPFIAFSESINRKLIEYAANSWPTDELLLPIAADVEKALPAMLKRWKHVPAFVDHVDFLQRAVERYQDKDYLSVVSILYPRIEGLLRSHQKLTDPKGRASQQGLSESAVKEAEIGRHPSTPLLPTRFRNYLESVYFADFDPNDSSNMVSRNSVGHGVASSATCSLKPAVISLLLVDQLSYLVSTASRTVTGVHPK